MRLASVRNRATIVAESEAGVVLGVDVARVSNGRFGPDLPELYDDWDEFRDWAESVDAARGEPIDLAAFDNPAPRPRQVFAIGLNYLNHAAEAGLDAARDVVPPTFTKYPTSLASPFAPLTLPSEKVDWEVELVVVIGRRAERVAATDAWSYVAGVAVGQDYSERDVQMAGPVPQFSLAKSFPGFSPIGPWVVTPDELSDRDDLELVCEINGEQVQKGRTSAMVWPVADLIASLSGVCPLLPGDVIFTGTPAGVGMARSPQRFLSPGDVVVSRVEGIGEIQQECVRARA
ncbi:fumarylacetoacetate hydrolase family protein [Nocardia vinacea]|uniref:Fumarylacetoacetate hydrolase family protein n=2 Tax=Nocardia vinacea TaxID=96468 RepID=A0ABZ1Z6Y2_9NOCA